MGLDSGSLSPTNPTNGATSTSSSGAATPTSDGSSGTIFIPNKLHSLSDLQNYGDAGKFLYKSILMAVVNMCNQENQANQQQLKEAQDRNQS